MRKKITWDFVSIELTRKCQLKCKHCFRGEAQNKNISIKTLDNFLKNTEIIGKIHFTGGEPTLALDEMEYVADMLREYRIPLFAFQIVTNGYEKSEKFCEIVKKFHEIIQICFLDDDKDVSPYLQICVSCDRYHTEFGYNPEETVDFYKDRLKGYAKVTRFYDGDMPNATGRGKTLPEAINIPLKTEKIRRQVEYLSKNHKPMCPYGRTYNIVHPEQIYVVCEMSLDINGRILFYGDMQGDSIENDREQAISDVNTTEDILNDIKKYNIGKMSCLDRMVLSTKELQSQEIMIKTMQELMKADMVLESKGVKANAYNRLVDLYADKHIFPIDENKDRSKYLDATPLGQQILTKEQIENYKEEILKDDEVYSWKNS